MSQSVVTQAPALSADRGGVAFVGLPCNASSLHTSGQSRCESGRQLEPLLGMFAAALAEVQTILQPLSHRGVHDNASLPSSNSGTDIRDLSHRLRGAVLRMGAASSIALEASAELNEARYALVALIDEWMIHQLEWNGRKEWLTSTLEREIFGSCSAGRKLFTSASSLHARHTNRELRRQLAAIYLLVILLGFSGEWRGDSNRLAEYKAALQATIDIEPSPEQAFPQAYDYCLSSATETRIAPLAPWWFWSGIAFGGYLLVSTFLWFWLTAPLSNTLSRLGY